MNKEEILSSGSYTLLNKVTEKIINWDYTPLVGYGSFIKHHHYAHIEIKIYPSIGENVLQTKNEVIWNVPINSIPKDFDYKSAVLKSLTFFLEYISALKGERKDLTFEINDASYSFDTRFISDYEYATIYAIVDCFDSSVLNFSKEYVERVKSRYQKDINHR